MSYLTSIAAKSARYKNFRQEFGVGILITAFVRFLTGAISIFAGYFYFANLLSGISTENKTIPIILAVLVLAIVEFFSAWLLAKLTKAALHHLYIRAFVLSIFAGFTFTVSFVSSTNGLAMRQSGRVDNSAEIRANFETETQAAQAKYQTLIDELKSQIQAEKDNPQGWRNGQRFYLTPVQLKRIDRINQKISSTRDSLAAELKSIHTAQKSELTDNRATMTETAEKYYNFIAIILLLSALSNITLQVFYVKIYREEKKEFAQIDDVNIIKGEIMSNLWDGMRNEASIMRGVIAQNLAIMNTISDPKNEALQIMSSGEKTRTAAPKIRGFKPATETDETDDDEPQNTNRRNYNLSSFEPYFTTSTNTQNAKDDTRVKSYHNENHATEKHEPPKTKIIHRTVGARTCPHCGTSFLPNHNKQIYCCKAHQIEAWEMRNGKKLGFNKNNI